MSILQRLPAVIMTAGFVSMLHNTASLAAPIVVQPGEGQLQRAIAEATDGDTLQLEPGVHRGPVVIDRSIALRGENGAIISGSGEGTVVIVDAPDVELTNVTVRGSGAKLSTEDSGIFVTAAGDRARIAGNRLEENLIGIYLKGPDAATVSDNTILGRQDLRVNERGNGVQLWNTPGSIVERNDVRFGRDGIFVTSSRDNSFRDNRFSDLRFAIHYMYTNNSSVTGNLSTGNKVGYALMYSTNLVVQANQSLGDSERGIFFNFTNDSQISENTVSPGTASRGPEKCVFVYNSNFNTMHRNHFEACDIGIHFTAGSEQNFLWENNFIANRNQVKYVGTRELEWSRDSRGNYWSDHIAFDLDGDGTANKSYRPNSISDQILWRYPMAKLLMNSPVLQILQWAQSQFPALHPGGVTDSHPLMQPLPPAGAG
jgi:nitrous oxidase accessory protein